MIERENGPGYRDLRSSEERIFIAPHWGRDPGEPPRRILPAMGMALGKTSTGNQPDLFHPAITMTALSQPAALCFIPTADELESFAEAMQKMAAEMRAAADAQAAEAIQRARNERKE
jgi:hypothetical protein